MLEQKDDEYFMKQAFAEAKKAFEDGEVPVGAVVVCQGQIIARAHNQTQLLDDVTAGYSRHNDLLHPKTKVVQGPMAEESKQILQDFFQAKRKKSG